MGTRQIKRRFSLINQDRLKRIYDSLSESQRMFLDILPLLFHTNHPLLPGYVSKNTPAGICDYRPSEKANQAATRVTRSFKPEKRALRSFQLDGLYMMGSGGTIAYSRHSDFDIWVCHRKGLSASELNDLQEKANRLEQWAMEMRLEVHFFIFNAEEFRIGSNEGLSDEHSGSSQYYLLLDEFYRSGLVIAGLSPLWWMVPADQVYDEYIGSQTHKRLLNPKDFIDFGGLGQIPAEEFFGATLWHLYKSINSPYKSVLKLMLMEVYADEYPEMNLLSSVYKQTVYDGVTDLEQLDPYLLMYRKVEEYLMTQNDSVRLDFLRRSFYLKINEQLSRSTKNNWRRETLSMMVKSWGWEAHQIHRLDNKQDWTLHTVLDERKDLIRTLTHSYRKLSQFARRQTSNSNISQQDLNILGRRLYAAFEKKSGKIELINRGITSDLYEKQVTLHEFHQAGKPASWLLFSGQVSVDEASHLTPMKRSGSAMDLLSWCHFNKIISEDTRIQCFSRTSDLNVPEIKTTIESLNTLFPSGEIAGSSSTELSEIACIRQAALFVNAGHKPKVSQLREGELLASTRSNALSYGGLHENLATRFDLLIETSWQEIFCFHYEGIGGLLEAICKYLFYSPPQTNQNLPLINVRCFTDGYGQVIQQSIQQIISELIKACKGQANSTFSYVLESANEYHLLQIVDNVPEYSHLSGLAQLTRKLGHTQSTFCPVVFNRETLQRSPLPVIYRNNRPGRIQLYFHVKQAIANIYILDEMGSLYYQTQSYHSRPALLNHYSLFLMAILNRRKCNLHSVETQQIAFPLDFYECQWTSKDGFRLQVIPYTEQDIPTEYFDVQVICTHETAAQKNITIYCEGQEFSTIEHGTEIFTAVARHVMKHRSSKASYPVYITDIDLSQGISPAEHDTSLQTAHYLAYKKNIELQLKKAMENL